MLSQKYTITGTILKNIATIEYCKAIIENTTILQNWQKQLEKEARIRTVYATLQNSGTNIERDKIKRFIEGLQDKIPKEVHNLINTLEIADDMSTIKDLEEDSIKTLHRIISEGLVQDSKLGTYRSKAIPGKTHSEEVLAQVVELFDWYNSLEARETHPILLAGILKARLEMIQPFEQNDFAVINFVAAVSLKSNGYGLNNYMCLEERYVKSRGQYKQLLDSLDRNPDFTQWLEYFTENISAEAMNIKEKIVLLARDTKLAKASGRVKLTERQQRIVEYIQDYGILRNKDFARIFPDISEDSVLRDLKELIKEGIVVKTGSTKSSVYEIR